jgi:hypothetical protein
LQGRGYRQGWKIEYTDKIDPANVSPEYFPMGLPSLILPEDPSPLPEEIVYEINLHWYATKYAEDWKKGCSEGTADGEDEGKAAGKLAREAGDDYRFAYESGYKRGYNDATLDLVSMHDNQGNRQLRVERKMREQYANGYLNGYDEAMEAKEERELVSVERDLTSATCTQKCQLHHRDTTLNFSQWAMCRQLFPTACPSRRRMQEGEWSHVPTLPMDGVRGGDDFKNLIVHILDNKCRVEDVVFEVWKVCPAVTA